MGPSPVMLIRPSLHFPSLLIAQCLVFVDKRHHRVFGLNDNYFIECSSKSIRCGDDFKRTEYDHNQLIIQIDGCPEAFDRVKIHLDAFQIMLK